MKSDRSNQANAKQLKALGGRSYLEQSEYCKKCNEITDISLLTIPSLLCSACTPRDIKKLKELFKRGVENV